MAKSFAQNLRYFRANFFLGTFALFLRMKSNDFARFCAIFCVRMKRNLFWAIFLRNLRKPASFTQNVLGKLSKIDILSLEFTTEDLFHT